MFDTITNSAETAKELVSLLSQSQADITHGFSEIIAQALEDGLIAEIGEYVGAAFNHAPGAKANRPQRPLYASDPGQLQYLARTGAMKDAQTIARDGYFTQLFAWEEPLLDIVRENALLQGVPLADIRPIEGKILQTLIRARSNAQEPTTVVEIGALAGYSAIYMALALPKNGKIYTCEVNPKHVEVARQNIMAAAQLFPEHHLAEKIIVLEGPANDTLRTTLATTQADLVFIDADKNGYPGYFSWAMQHLKDGGIVAAHNASRGGRSHRPSVTADRAMHAMNWRFAHHSALEGTGLNINDGLVISVKDGGLGR